MKKTIFVLIVIIVLVSIVLSAHLRASAYTKEVTGMIDVGSIALGTSSVLHKVYDQDNNAVCYVYYSPYNVGGISCFKN